VNDLLDDRLRTMMRTATADAPEAPSVDDLQAITVVAAEPAIDRRRSVLAVAAAAVVVLGAVGALVFSPNGDAGPDPADEPDTTGVVEPGAYLDAYFLPNQLPQGWRIIELDRFPGGSGGTFIGNSTSSHATRDDEPS
jgi:hypothetical protein